MGSIPLRPTSGLDDPQQQRRDRETINDILTFRADDSRRRTPAERAAGVVPVNFAYEPGNVFRQMTAAQVADVSAGTGSVDVTAALVDTHRAYKKVRYPRGTYLVSGTSLVQYENTNDIDIEFEGATITYGSQVFSAGVVWDMFQFKTCERVSIRGQVKLQGTLLSSDVGPALSSYGPFGFHFYFRQRNITIDTVVADGILIPVMFERMPAQKALSVAGIGAGGSGYTVNDVLTVTGGEPTTATQLTATAVSGGAVTAATVTTAGLYPNTGGPNNYDVNIPTVAGTDDGMSVTGGTGTGAKFNIFWEDADVTTRAENIAIKSVTATNCFYGIEFSKTGFGVTIDELNCDFTHRTLVITGSAERIRANVTYRHSSDDSVCLSSIFGLAPRNVEINVHMRPPTQASYVISNGAAGNAVRFNFASSVPGKFEDIRIHTNATYGSVTGRGGNLLIIIKEDAKGRGRQFNGLKITGRVDGFGDIDSGSGTTHVIATGTGLSWAAAPIDAFRDFEIHPFMNNSGLDILIDQNVINDTMPTTRFAKLPDAVVGSPEFKGNVSTGSSASFLNGAKFVLKRQAPTYGTSVAINAGIGNEFDITATNGTGFTVANPTSGNDGQRITITIRNASGGALGAVTWDTLYKLSAWTSPANANSRSIDFKSNGTNWVQVSQTGVDVPN